MRKLTIPALGIAAIVLAAPAHAAPVPCQQFLDALVKGTFFFGDPPLEAGKRETHNGFEDWGIYGAGTEGGRVIIASASCEQGHLLAFQSVVTHFPPDDANLSAMAIHALGVTWSKALAMRDSLIRRSEKSGDVAEDAVGDDRISYYYSEYGGGIRINTPENGQ